MQMAYLVKRRYAPIHSGELVLNYNDGIEVIKAYYVERKVLSDNPIVSDFIPRPTHGRHLYVNTKLLVGKDHWTISAMSVHGSMLVSASTPAALPSVHEFMKRN